jgi:hypothetical protein
LALASCSFSADGLEAIINAVVPSPARETVHPTLSFLNFGFMKGTYVFNCVGNYIRDRGAWLIAHRLLPQLKTLRYIDICHNQITVSGMAEIASALSDGRGSSLCGLVWAQYAQTRSYALDARIKALLYQNEVLWGKDELHGDGDEAKWAVKGGELLRAIEVPSYVADILSVYRTKN